MRTCVFYLWKKTLQFGVIDEVYSSLNLSQEDIMNDKTGLYDNVTQVAITNLSNHWLLEKCSGRTLVHIVPSSFIYKEECNAELVNFYINFNNLILKNESISEIVISHDVSCFQSPINWGKSKCNLENVERLSGTTNLLKYLKNKQFKLNGFCNINRSKQTIDQLSHCNNFETYVYCDVAQLNHSFNATYMPLYMFNWRRGASLQEYLPTSLQRVYGEW